jgi:large subunit ribosomal protein L10
MPRPEKVAAVEEIAGRFKEAPAALLTEYRGLSVGEIAEVRGALREAQADYKILKNSLARIAVREVGLEELVEMLQGPVAIAFCRGDAVDAAKALDDVAKKFPVITIKGGVIEGRVIDAEQAGRLAKLESRDVQLTKIAMMSNQPLQLTVNAFSALLRDLASMLAQVMEKKESGEAPSAEGIASETEASAGKPGADETATTNDTDKGRQDEAASGGEKQEE